jgi:hypothetical protein
MVHNGKFLDYDSASALNELDSTLPESGKHREALTRFVGEFPFSDFVRGALQIEIYREQPYTEDKNPTSLTTIEPYRDVAAVAARFVTEFVSLPWKYTLTVALPHDIGDFFRRAVKTYALSNTVRIVTADEQFAAEYPPPPAPAGPLNYLRMATLADLMRGPQNEWDPNKVYLQVQVEGFIPLFGRTTPVEDGIGHIKSFFGLGIAHHLFDFERKYGEAPTKEDLWIHRNTGGKWEFESSTDLDRSASSTLYGLAMNRALAKPEPDEQDIAFVKRTLDNIQPPFATGAPSARILLASQWHFESFGGSDEMLSYVQAAVVLEILLGDKAASDAMGLGELLRNRCAYLISRTQAEREEILRDFRGIYDVRSNIVHAGKKRLNHSEWRLFMRLRWICQRVIQEEIKLLAGKRR